jgi:hypothetical protein
MSPLRFSGRRRCELFRRSRCTRALRRGKESRRERGSIHCRQRVPRVNLMVGPASFA